MLSYLKQYVFRGRRIPVMSEKIDDRFQFFPAINGESDLADDIFSVPNYPDWLIFSNSLFIRLPREILQEVNSFILYFTFDLLVQAGWDSRPNPNIQGNFDSLGSRFEPVTIYHRQSDSLLSNFLQLRVGSLTPLTSQFDLPVTYFLQNSNGTFLQVQTLVFRNGTQNLNNNYIMLAFSRTHYMRPQLFNVTLFYNQLAN